MLLNKLLLSVMLLLAFCKAVPLSHEASLSGPLQAFAGEQAAGSVNLDTFFTEEERSTWKSYSLKKLRLYLISLGCVLVFYVLFIFTGCRRKWIASWRLPAGTSST